MSGSAGLLPRHPSKVSGQTYVYPAVPGAGGYAEPVGDLPFDLPPRRAADLAARGEAELIDVREPYEREAGHIPGSRHVELARLADSADALPLERPIVFLCRVGARSAQAAFAFRRAGFDAHNLDGGIVAWAACGLPVDGEIAYH
jgi:rhodanese-related sulfurtransferase